MFLLRNAGLVFFACLPPMETLKLQPFYRSACDLYVHTCEIRCVLLYIAYTTVYIIFPLMSSMQIKKGPVICLANPSYIRKSRPSSRGGQVYLDDEKSGQLGLYLAGLGSAPAIRQPFQTEQRFTPFNEAYDHSPYDDDV